MAVPITAHTTRVSPPGKPLSFPASTRQVQISVIVHDKDGKPVSDLTAKDFQLFDKWRLNTAWEDQAQSKAQIIRFLGQIQPNDRVGLYLLESNRLRVLHDFTTDVSSLLRSLSRHRGRTSSELR